MLFLRIGSRGSGLESVGWANMLLRAVTISKLIA
jgi:hypothetical protein